MSPIKSAKSNPEKITFFWSERVQDWKNLFLQLGQPLLLPNPVVVQLVRHGETETNAQSLITGAQNVALTPKGKFQAREIGRHLNPNYDLAFHSPLSRSQETLQLALGSGRVTVGQVISDHRLSERSLGRLELQPWQPIAEYSRGDLNYAPEGGDSYAEVARRILSFLLDLRHLICELGYETVLICGHMGPMRILAGIFEELRCAVEVLRRSFENTKILQFRWERLTMPGFLEDVTALP